MTFDDLCNAGLVLQLGSPSLTGKPNPNPTPTTAHKLPEHSLTLSLSGETCLVSKRKREFSTDEGEDDEVVANERKKLRLTKGQSVLLEESFKIHSTLSPKQKQELARELKLRPRQVEVWFQNRRARSKLKQTEVDCEFMKKCCDTLTEENIRLQKEIHELKAPAQLPVYMQFSAASVSMCPSCEKTGANETMAPKPHLHNRFTNPSAAC